MLKKSGLMQLYKGTEDFGSLGGLENLKSFAKRSLMQSTGDPLKTTSWDIVARSSRYRKICLRKVLGSGDRKTYLSSRYWRADGYSCWTNGSQHSSSTGDCRYNVSLNPLYRRIGKGIERCSRFGSNRFRCFVSPVWYSADMDERSYVKCLPDCHLQRHWQDATRIDSCGTF